MTQARSTAFVLGTLLTLGILGCAPDFASPSRLRTLRVMAVQKDKPYARPGDTVRLSMLLDDAGQPKPRGVKVTWFGGCENPRGDIYAGCFSPDTSGGAKPTSPVGVEGLDFSVSLSSGIIRDRQAPPGNQPAYGMAFVFFAACPGTLNFVIPQDLTRIETLPIQCVDASGKPFGADDFVLGYTQLWAYDDPDFTNANPIVTGFTLDGNPVTPECIGAETAPGASIPGCLPLERAELGMATPAADGGPDGAGGDAGPASVPAPPDPCVAGLPGCFDVCTKEHLTDCPKHEVTVDVDPNSAEPDSVQNKRDGTDLQEQMWIDYYVDGGGVDSVVRLLNDAKLRWQADHGVKVSVPTVPGPFHLWAAVHDNRGGVGWARLGLSARARP